MLFLEPQMELINGLMYSRFFPLSFIRFQLKSLFKCAQLKVIKRLYFLYLLFTHGGGNEIAEWFVLVTLHFLLLFFYRSLSLHLSLSFQASLSPLIIGTDNNVFVCWIDLPLLPFCCYVTHPSFIFVIAYFSHFGDIDNKLSELRSLPTTTQPLWLTHQLELPFSLVFGTSFSPFLVLMSWWGEWLMTPFYLLASLAQHLESF